MIKNTVTKLVITKNKRIADSSNMFSYAFEYFNEDVSVWREILKMPADDLMRPTETYNINEIITHKQHCCMNIDLETFVVEEVEV